MTLLSDNSSHWESYDDRVFTSRTLHELDTQLEELVLLRALSRQLLESLTGKQQQQCFIHSKHF